MCAASRKPETEEHDTSESAHEHIPYNDMSRRDVRSVIFHLLYAMEAFDYQTSLDEIIDNFNRGFGLDIPHDSEACTVARAVIEERDKLDEAIKPFLINWRFERIGTCTKLILRFAVWELIHTHTPHNIIINEAIELAKCFSETDAYKFINGILDEAVKSLRPQEIKENEEKEEAVEEG